DVKDGGLQLRRGGGDVAGTAAIDGEGGFLGLLGTVDVGPGGAVDDNVGALEVELALQPAGIGDVELGAAIADDVVAGVAGGEHHVATQHSGRPGNQELHQP